MANEILQFGEKPIGACHERLSAYAVVFNSEGKILAVQVHDEYHLPGGGIDDGEDSEMAVTREAMEEAGCEINNLSYIGKANQFFPDHNLNKVGTFYRAELVSYHPEKSVEDTHEGCWVEPEKFIEGNSGEFQKWAVRESLKV
jgi:8-oxo-dGTP pyrophosphatase MutT (NUDIX family)